MFATTLALLLVSAWPFAGDIPSRYFALTRSLVEERTCAVDSFHTGFPDKAFRDGHYYLAASPGPSFAAAPVYVPVYLCGGSPLIGLIAATLWVGVLPGALAFWGVWRLGEVLPRVPAPEPWRLAVVTAAAATFVTPLCTVFYASALTVACAVWALVHLTVYLRARRPIPEDAAVPDAERGLRRLVGAGALLGALVCCEYSAAPLALLGTGVVAAESWRARRPGELLAFLGGAAPLALVLGAYHWACFGAPWRTGYSFHANPNFVELLATGYKGYCVPTGHSLYETLLGSARGLLVYAPPVALGIACARRGWAHEPECVALGLGVGACYWLLNASRVLDWYAGYSWGPRYQAFAAWFWLLPLFALRDPPRWAWRAWAVLVAAGAAVTALGLGTRWRSTLEASLREAYSFGLQCKLTTLALTGDPAYYPPGLAERTGTTLVLGLLALAALLVAWGWIWGLGRRGWTRLGLAWLAAALLALVPWSVSSGRGSALRRELQDREFLDFTRHFPSYENDVRAAQAALALQEDAQAVWFAERALAARPGDELAELVRALGAHDAQALERLAREASDPGIRGRATRGR
ncbi:MAG: hypothetical protein R3F62_09065 [Planctomycetota bacterium]